MAGNKTFIDSSAFIALFNKRDQFHKKAMAVFEELRKSHTLYVSDCIVDEVVTFLNNRCGKKIADKALKALAESDYLDLIVMGRDLFEQTVINFGKCRISGVSFTDVSVYL